MAEWIQVASVEEVTAGRMRTVEVDGEWIGLYNVDGHIHATQAHCTHAEAFLTDGLLDGEVVTCPLHGAQFNVCSGEVLSMPAIVPLATYPVKIEDGTVFIEWEE